MIQPPIPPEEEARLAELLSYNVIDTESDALLDDITLLASQICDTPIALISLVDPDRQWFKSRVGIDATETHRNISFCGHVVANKTMLEVNDALSDERFFDNPLVTENPNIRFYAGAPLITEKGYALGTLCTIDQKPKVLSPSQRTALKTLADSVMAHLDLRKKNEELIKINRMKTHYLSELSHDLRTPLNAICTFGKLLEQEARVVKLPALFRDALGHITTSSSILLKTVDAVLGVEDTEKANAPGKKKAISTRSFFHHIFHIIDQQLQKYHIELRSNVEDSIPETLIFDDTRFCKVLLKILSHALIRAEGDAFVDVMICYQSGNLVVLFKDNGPGISQEQHQALYDDDKQDENNPLSGLRIMTDELNGHLKVKNGPSDGIIIIFSVPATVDTHDNTDVPETGLTYTKQNPKILLVEDNEINQEVMRSLFGRNGLSIDIADDGETALKMVDQQVYDIIFMDINLPGISGVETTRRIRETQPAIPIIAVTADVIIDKQVLRASGMDAVVTKPVDINELNRLLNLYLITDSVFN
ncbi:response regulator [Aestuariibacter sp. A3R04]|uniref:response regulator n=1 Tax=Aestuariibacter sp. A3R04 TaxID=2841571 RepID=UPI001C08BB3C|nr:response regulator [Aestuariibacter sp. A3R04]MBU3021571.1 response regulator [Aestuariibacter sp. A3R04]